MARSDTRYSIYPAPKAVEIVGSTSPALNQAIECWAALLARATADNSKTFFSSEEIFDAYVLNAWGLLAEVLKEMHLDPDFPKPAELLATAVEDEHRLEDVAEKWFKCGFDGEEYVEALDRSFCKFVQKLRSLDYAHAWAVIVAVQWFWEHHDEGIDIKKDQWWTLTFRRQWHQARVQKSAKRS